MNYKYFFACNPFHSAHLQCPNFARHVLLIFSLTVVSLFACVFLLPKNCRAQQSVPPKIQWEQCYGGSAGDEAYSIQQTADSGYIIAGATASTNYDVTGHDSLIESITSKTGPTTYDTILPDEYWIVKLSKIGNIQWQRCIGGTHGDEAHSVLQTSDGGYIVAGESASWNGSVTGHYIKVITTPMGTDTVVFTEYWIVKLTAAGNIQWQECLGGQGSGNDIANSIQQTSDGGYIVAGSSSSTDGDVTGNKGESDYWIVKLSPAGGIQWEKSYGGSHDDEAQSIQQTADGGYIVAGYSNSSDGDVTGHHGGDTANDNLCGDTVNYDYWILKIDTNGAIQWEKSLGGGCPDMAYSVIQTKDGGYIVAGSTLSSDGDVAGNHGFWDYWVVKLSSMGTIQWDSCYGGVGWDEAYSIKQTLEGGYIVAGFSNSGYDDVNGNHLASHDYWILKLSPIGAIQWEYCYGGGSTDEAYSIQQCYDGGYIVAGLSSSTDFDVTGHHGGDTINDDYWIVKLTPYPAVIASSQQQTFHTLLCGGREFDTLTVHSTGVSPLVIYSAVFGADSQFFTLLSPMVFPVTVMPGDSVRVIVSFAPGAAGTSSTSLSLINNDSLHSPWNVAFTGTKDSVGFDLQGVANDTLDFGEVPCGTPADTSIMLVNTSTLGSLFTYKHFNTTYFSITPASAFINSGGVKTIAAHFIGNVVSGVYRDSVLVTDTACGVTQTMYIKAAVTGVILTLNAPPDTTICTGDTLMLTAAAGFATYLWQNGATTQTIAVTKPGNYYVSASGPGNCPARSDTVSVRTATKPNASIVASGSLSFCTGDSVVLTAPAGFATYEWSDGETSQRIVAKTSGKYFVLVATAGGCLGASDTVIATAVAVPAPRVAELGTLSFCIGDSVVLIAPGSFASYQWSDGETSQSITIKTAGTFTVTCTNAIGCSGTSAPITTTVGDSLSPVITGPAGFCSGDSAVLDAGSGYDTYAWSTGATSETIAVTAPGTYSVAVAKGQCSGSSQPMSVTEYPAPAPVITMTGTLSSCSADTVILFASSGYLNYYWSTGDTTQTIAVTAAGSYTVSVMDSLGCSGASPAATITQGAAPNIAVSSPLAVTLCANEGIVEHATIINLSADTQALAETASGSPLFTITPNMAVIAPGDSVALTITFQGASDTGAYSAKFTFRDSCGGGHVIAAAVNVQQQPPLHLSLALNDASAQPGRELVLYILAKPVSSLAGGLSCAVASDTAILQLDSVATPCNATNSKSSTGTSIVINSCTSITGDTLATLFYRPIAAFPDSTYIRLSNATIANPCDSVTVDADSTVALAYNGFDLVTALIDIYPNPVTNSGTTVQFSNVQQANVTLTLYDMLGRAVERLVNEPLKPGTYVRQFPLNSLLNGVYFLAMQDGAYYAARQILVLR